MHCIVRNAVGDKFDDLQGNWWCTNVTGVKDAVSTYGDARAMCIYFWGVYFTNYFFICDLSANIHRNFIIVDNFKRVCPFGALVVWDINSLAYALAQSAKFLGVQFIPMFLILLMFPQLSVFEGIYRFFIEYGIFPFKKKLAWVTAYWCSHRGDAVSRVWAHALYNRFIRHWVWLGVMWPLRG